ncbi:hypothetical protein AGIG_G11566 [Arapaima gigas]
MSHANAVEYRVLITCGQVSLPRDDGGDESDAPEESHRLVEQSSMGLWGRFPVGLQVAADQPDTLLHNGDQFSPLWDLWIGSGCDQIPLQARRCLAADAERRLKINQSRGSENPSMLTNFWDLKTVAVSHEHTMNFEKHSTGMMPNGCETQMQADLSFWSDVRLNWVGSMGMRRNRPGGLKATRADTSTTEGKSKSMMNDGND